MIKKVIIEIFSDARESHKPIEALRIAAGLAVSDLPVDIWLHPGAEILFSDPPENFVDVEYRSQFLAVLENHGVSVHNAVDTDFPGDDVLVLKF